METAIVTSLIAGFFSLATALGSVWLKHHLETSPSRPGAPEPSPRPASEPAAVSPPPVTGLAGAAAVIVIGFALGAGSRLLRGAISGPIHYEAIASLIVLVAGSAWLALAHRKARSSIWHYELETFSLWAAYVSGWSLVHGGVWTDTVVVMGAWWAGCAVVGGIIVSLRRRGAA